MLRIKYIGLFLIVLIGVNSCSLLNIPPKQPKKITVSWNKSGGMLPSYSNVYISTDSCIWKSYNEINLTKNTFNISETELLDLYSVFYNNNFTKIESSKQDVSNRAGSDIYINIDGEKYELLNSGTNFIQEQFTNNFKNIEQAILQTYEEVNNKQNKDIIIDMDTSLTNSAHNVVLYLNNKEVYNEQKTGEFNSLHHSNSIKDNSIHFRILLKANSDSSVLTVLNKYELTLNALPTRNHLILTLVDGNLILK